MMRTTTALLLAVSLTVVQAQVSVDVPLHFTGADSDRTVEGLGAPAQHDALITVEGSVRAEWMWATASLAADTLTLQLAAASDTLRDGTLLRFAAPSIIAGSTWIRVDTLAPKELVRTDGMPPADGDLASGQVCEVLFAGGRFHLLSAAVRGCPPGYLQVNANYCIEAASSATMGWYQASDHCEAKGGKLCTWNEYQAGCYFLAGQFTNIFTEWEWIDDTSNHTHGANQVARTTCQGHRTRIVTVPGRVRCCHHLR
ncbi:MAG: hypothetical protein IPL52_00995 [Flavobacteriales bacterium]|nr:hypothetical protein [Flavobacteriales bacterium]